MIDMLIISIPLAEFVPDGRRLVFISDDYSNGVADLSILSELANIPMSGDVIQCGGGKVVTENLKHPFESIPSHLGSLAFKIYHKGSNSWPFIQLKASPAKLLQGHNVFGSESFEVGVMSLLYTFMMRYPEMKHLINVDAATISEIDVTYSSRCENEMQSKQVIDYLGSLSYGQTKTREGYATTVYWGKVDSPHRKLKAYLKHDELLNYMNDLRKKNKNGRNDHKIRACEEQLAFSIGLVRFEGTIKKRWLEDRKIPTSLFAFLKYVKLFEQENGASFAQHLWGKVWEPVFKTFEGQKMIIYKDDELYDALILRFKKISAKTGKTSISAAQAAFRTYRAIKSEGWNEAKRTISSSTFSRHVGMIAQCGLSRAYLQNLDKPEVNIIPLMRFVDVDFQNQRPCSYVEPKMEDIIALIAA